jgi:hypothetical protein
MRVALRSLLPAVILAAVVLVASPQGAAALQAAPASPAASAPTPRVNKNPKLSTQIAALRGAIPQTYSKITAQKISALADFSVASLPKSLQDEIRAGRMQITKDAEVQAFIEVTEITPQHLEILQSLGVKVQIIGVPSPDKSKGEVLTKVSTIQGLLPAAMIDHVAALYFVRYIRLPDYGFKNTGSIDSEGDQILQAAEARSTYGLTGSSVRVGVVSDGIGGVFASGCTTCGAAPGMPSPIATGDLPPSTGTRNSSGVLTSASGGIIAKSFRSDGNLEACLGSCDTTGLVGSEGAAMLEVIYDMAPDVQLYFANFDTVLAFEQAVDYIAANTDVGVDDIAFPTPPFDGTSPVSTNTATELNTDAKPIRGYFTSVANQFFDHWGELYTDSGQNPNLSCPTPSPENGDVQRFQATANTIDAGNLGPQASNPLSLTNGQTLVAVLAWDDPFTGSSNDYDLYLYLAPGGVPTTPLACSQNPQTGIQPPVESFSYTNSSGATQEVAILIQNVGDAAAVKNLDLFVGGVGTYQDMNYYTPSGSVPAESDAGGTPVSVVAVGATDAQLDARGDLPATVMESFSSQGPTENTPQAPSRIKPDVTATDGVKVSGAGGFGSGDTLATTPCNLGQTPCYFFGTSAAAPHVAGIAALLLQSAPCLLSSSNVNAPATARANLRGFLTSTAVPLSGVSQAVPNNIEGYGLIDALAAAKETIPSASAGSPQTLTGTSSNGVAVTLTGSGTDPDSCPLTYNWSGACGAATGATANVSCPLGVSTETLTVSNAGATASLPTSTVQITVSDFTLPTPSPATATVSAGGTATYTISVAHLYGAFSNAVSLACSNLPNLTTCTFQPTSVTPGATSMSSTLTLATTAPSSALGTFPSERPGSRLYAALLYATLLGTLALLLFVRSVPTKSPIARALRIVAASSLACIILLIPACGGGGSTTVPPPIKPGTPTGSYTVTITGSSNSLQHTTTVQLTVQ